VNPNFTKPVIAFMQACEDLLSDAITRDTLTSEEREILQVNLDTLMEKFFPAPRQAACHIASFTECEIVWPGRSQGQ
jgi:hypothetical protein